MSSFSNVKIWTNTQFPEHLHSKLIAGIQPQTLIVSQSTSKLNLVSAPVDAGLEDAEIAFGQPDAQQCIASRKLKWVHLTSAGYTSYDRDDLKQAFRLDGKRLTTSSGVYNEPCAQHLLAMMMAFARQLLPSLETQRSNRCWPAARRRSDSFLLNSQTAIIVGYGEIGQRLTELLAPFRMKLFGVRRTIRGDESIPMVPISELARIVPTADHIINILPANPDSTNFFDRKMFQSMRPGTHFYNIGRGGTVDQDALVEALDSERIAAAYLDVMTPEPLPPEHSLWNHPKCFLTPHTAGGFREEMEALVSHFLANFERFLANLPLKNCVIGLPRDR